MTGHTGTYTAINGDDVELYQENGMWVIRTDHVGLPVMNERHFPSEAAARRAFADVVLDDLTPAAVTS